MAYMIQIDTIFKSSCCAVNSVKGEPKPYENQNIQ